MRRQPCHPERSEGTHKPGARVFEILRDARKLAAPSKMTPGSPLPPTPSPAERESGSRRDRTEFHPPWCPAGAWIPQDDRGVAYLVITTTVRRNRWWPRATPYLD